MSYDLKQCQWQAHHNLLVPSTLAREASWATMSITSFIRSALSLTFQVRKRVVVRVILREHLPDDFLLPPTQAPLTRIRSW